MQLTVKKLFHEQEEPDTEVKNFALPYLFLIYDAES